MKTEKEKKVTAACEQLESRGKRGWREPDPKSVVGRPASWRDPRPNP